MWFSICPRCSERGLEILETHSFCVNCNFSPDFEEVSQPLIPSWALEALKEFKEEARVDIFESINEMDEEEI